MWLTVTTSCQQLQQLQEHHRHYHYNHRHHYHHHHYHQQQHRVQFKVKQPPPPQEPLPPPPPPKPPQSHQQQRVIIWLQIQDYNKQHSHFYSYQHCSKHCRYYCLCNYHLQKARTCVRTATKNINTYTPPPPTVNNSNFPNDSSIVPSCSYLSCQKKKISPFSNVSFYQSSRLYLYLSKPLVWHLKILLVALTRISFSYSPYSTSSLVFFFFHRVLNHFSQRQTSILALFTFQHILFTFSYFLFQTPSFYQNPNRFFLLFFIFTSDTHFHLKSNRIFLVSNSTNTLPTKVDATFVDTFFIIHSFLIRILPIPLSKSLSDLTSIFDSHPTFQFCTFCHRFLQHLEVTSSQIHSYPSLPLQRSTNPKFSSKLENPFPLFSFRFPSQTPLFVLPPEYLINNTQTSVSITVTSATPSLTSCGPSKETPHIPIPSTQALTRSTSLANLHTTTRNNTIKPLRLTTATTSNTLTTFL